MVLSQKEISLIKQFFIDKPVLKAYLFGSFSRDEADEKSDVDILVEFSSPVGIEVIDLGNYLERILNQKVDLVSRNGIKPQYFKQIKGDLKYV